MEKRRKERFSVRQKDYYRNNMNFPYRVVNVSKTGCFIESSRILGRKESEIIFHLPLPADTDSLPLAARIVREPLQIDGSNSECIQYALEFDRMNDLCELILDAYLDFLQKERHVAKLEDTWSKLKNVYEKVQILVACEEKKRISLLQ